MKLPPLKVKRVALETLQKDPENVRVHGEKNLQAIKDSLSLFGQVEPLVVQKSTGRIIGGNGRLEAMLSLGWQQADIVEIDIPEDSVAALGIALNRTAELAEWDSAGLVKALEALGSEDFETTFLGFDAGDITKLESIGAEPTQPLEEWTGMPEFNQGDEMPYRTIKIHFRSEEPIKAFAALLKQTITDKTKYLYFPAQAPVALKELSYETSEE